MCPKSALFSISLLPGEAPLRLGRDKSIPITQSASSCVDASTYNDLFITVLNCPSAAKDIVPPSKRPGTGFR
jgi:hypothetical protein